MCALIRSTRRQFLRSSLTSGLALGSAGFAVLGRSTPTLAQTDPSKSVFQRFVRPPYLGTTFSQLQCRYIGLDHRAAFQDICQIGLDRIRLCAYWNEIETQPGVYDFSILDWLLAEADRNQIEVVLAVGMKVPRWTEFHFPQWVSDRYETGAGDQPLDIRSPQVAELSLKFVNAVVKHCRTAPAVKYWQIENEPFTKLEIAGGRFLSPEFVQKEVALVRSQQRRDQKILLTNAIHLPKPKLAEDLPAFQASFAAADAVGFNVYTKVPAGNSGYYLEPDRAFWDQLQDWQQQLVNGRKEAWVAEAQAEPWEPQKLVALDKPNYPSASPRRMQHLVDTLARSNYSTVLLWGCEYWYWHKTQGRNQWMWTVKNMVRSAKA